MEKVRVYNELEATYGELAQMLLQLGYKDTSNGTFFRFVYRKRKSIIQLPWRAATDIVVKANLAAFSYLLYMQGIIAERDDLAKGIEKNRFLNEKKATPLIDLKVVEVATSTTLL
jgi:hypothetical protein